jgi:hypothetical protein
VHSVNTVDIYEGLILHDVCFHHGLILENVQTGPGTCNAGRDLFMLGVNFRSIITHHNFRGGIYLCAK